MKNPIHFQSEVNSFRTVLSICLILLVTSLVSSQNLKNRSKITLMQGAFERKSYVKEFFADSVLVSIKLARKNIYTDRMISADKIKNISILSKPNHARGALRGLMIGAGFGSITGLINSTASKDNFFYTPPAQGFLQSYLVFVPVATLIGTIGLSDNYKTYILNGQLHEYHHSLDDMKALLNKQEYSPFSNNIK